MASCLTIRGPSPPLAGCCSPPGDKSIAHRALMLGAIARGNSRFLGVPDNHDIHATIACLSSLGVSVSKTAKEVVVTGSGSYFPKSADALSLNCFGSATTMRLMAGLCAGKGGNAIFYGDSSLSGRPMERILKPLGEMGASCQYLKQFGYPPFSIQVHGGLNGISYSLPIPSAQVKSAIIMAALGAREASRITGRTDSRDHLERMLPLFGGQIKITKDEHTGSPGSSICPEIEVFPSTLHGCELQIPGDFSSAAFLIAAACLIPGSDVFVHNCSANPGRTGLLRAMLAMGARIEILDEQSQWEPKMNLRVGYSALRAVEVPGGQSPFLIDEVPLFALLASQATGTSRLCSVGEARLKESDRLRGPMEELGKMGARIWIEGDDLLIEGKTVLKPASLDSRGDHRLAMTLYLASLLARGEGRICGWEAAGKSFPGFFKEVKKLTQSKGVCNG